MTVALEPSPFPKHPLSTRSAPSAAVSPSSCPSGSAPGRIPPCSTAPVRVPYQKRITKSLCPTSVLDSSKARMHAVPDVKRVCVPNRPTKSPQTQTRAKEILVPQRSEWRIGCELLRPSADNSRRVFRLPLVKSWIPSAFFRLVIFAAGGSCPALQSLSLSLAASI
jgi:hypothetical protein